VYPAENHEKKINGVSNKTYTHKSSNGQTNAGPITTSIQCGNCGVRNHTTNECQKPRAGHGNTDHVVCFQCNQVGHKRNTCPMNRPNRSAGPQRVAAMQQFTTHAATHNYNGPHHCSESRGDGEIKLACGCMMPVVAGALSPDRQEVIKMWKTKMTPCTTGSVSNTETMVLRDTGSITV